ncbi:MAG: hypothetical protein ACKPCM_14560 [Pseudanabaena sp.]
MNPSDTIQIAKDAFAKIHQQYPNLSIKERSDDPVELSFTIPVQDGLRYEVWLCLQNNDELHFSVSNFWCSWFSCSNPSVVEDYISVICGFLSGNNRILEHLQWGRCVKAELQRPSGGAWETRGSWRTWYFPLPWGWETRVLMNA